MSKTGIITFHASANCGSMLQAYALQIFLKSLNVTNEIIDFSNAGQRKMYSVFFSPKSIKEFLRLCLNTLFSPVLLRESKDFADFSRKYLELSEQKFYRNEELVEANLDYDCYVAGSDQVWNVKCKDADLAYFLNFVKEPQKKIAYAVSMGGTDINDLTQEKKQLYKKLVEDFSAISVRESNAKEWIDFIVLNENPFGFHLWYLGAYLYVLLIVGFVDKYDKWNYLFMLIPILLAGDLIFGKYSLLLLNKEYPYICP